MSRVIAMMNGCPDLSADDNSTVVIDGGPNGLSVTANLSAIHSNNSGIIYTCAITQSGVADASSCTSSLLRAFPGTLSHNGTPITINATYIPAQQACTASFNGKCSEYSYKADDKPNSYQLSDAGSENDPVLGGVAWATLTLPFGGGSTTTGGGTTSGNGNNGGGVQFTCGANTINYSYNCFNLEIANSCTDSCKSYLVFTPKNPLPAGCDTMATIGGGTGGASGGSNCSSGFSLANLSQQVGDYYLNINCDSTSGTINTILSNTIQQCTDCSF
jgi:hypothetical protein